MQEIQNEAAKVYQFTGLEIFFIGTTLLFLILNIYQLMETRRMKKELRIPVHSALVGLFNDIKSKMTTAHLVQQLLANVNNPHKDINTLKWEYNQFILFVVGQLQGFQETVVAVLTTLNPNDKEGKDTFKALEYGLTEDERKLRNQLMRRQLNLPDKDESSSTTGS